MRLLEALDMECTSSDRALLLHAFMCPVCARCCKKSPRSPSNQPYMECTSSDRALPLHAFMCPVCARCCSLLGCASFVTHICMYTANTHKHPVCARCCSMPSADVLLRSGVRKEPYITLKSALYYPQKEPC